MKYLVFLFLLIVGGVAAGGWYYVDTWLTTPLRSAAAAPVEYEVKSGARFNNVAEDLEKIGVIQNAFLLNLYARYTRQAEKIKTGYYAIAPGLTPPEVIDQLTKGKVMMIQFVVPEGWNTWQIAEKLAETFPKISKQQWLGEMNAPAARKKLPKELKNVEGFLFPETYTVSPKSTAQEIIAAMITEFYKHFDSEIKTAGLNLGLTPSQIVTLASIIEKETGKSEERKHISSVFHNRLKIKMRLQTDPTVIYGMWEKYDGNIRKKDLLTPTPYNSYTNDGLPPGPIASPGLASLQAAVQPDSTKDLYFVGKGDGSHFFSSNLKDHNQAVHQFQIEPFKHSKAKQ